MNRFGSSWSKTSAAALLSLRRAGPCAHPCLRFHTTSTDEKEVVREAENRAQGLSQREEFLNKLTPEERAELASLIKKATQKT